MRSFHLGVLEAPSGRESFDTKDVKWLPLAHVHFKFNQNWSSCSRLETCRQTDRQTDRKADKQARPLLCASLCTLFQEHVSGKL
jgi:hypothetical protein